MNSIKLIYDKIANRASTITVNGVFDYTARKLLKKAITNGTIFDIIIKVESENGEDLFKIINVCIQNNYATAVASDDLEIDFDLDMPDATYDVLQKIENEHVAFFGEAVNLQNELNYDPALYIKYNSYPKIYICVNNKPIVPTYEDLDDGGHKIISFELSNEDVPAAQRINLSEKEANALIGLITMGEPTLPTTPTSPTLG